VIADQALRAWKLEAPEVRQRFRLIAIIFPIVSFPLYQMLNPDRSSTLFRLGSLFDINRWLSMELWGLIPIGLLFLILLGFTALVFFFQEMVPVLSHTLDTRRPDGRGHHVAGYRTVPGERCKDPRDQDAGRCPHRMTNRSSSRPLAETGHIRVVRSDESAGRGQMEAALAHEMAPSPAAGVPC
jgi:hypothetical protein